MPRLSVSLDDEQDEWVEQEADRLRRSKAEICRRCIDMVRTGAIDTEEIDIGVNQPEPAGSAPERTGEHHQLAERIDELEQRLERLSATTDGPIPPRPTGSPEPRTETQPPGSNPRETATEPPTTGPKQAVTRSEIPDPPSGAKETRVVEYVKEYGPVSRADILDAFDDRIGELGIKPDSYWKRHARPALKESGAEFTRNVGWSFHQEL